MNEQLYEIMKWNDLKSKIYKVFNIYFNCINDFENIMTEGWKLYDWKINEDCYDMNDLDILHCLEEIRGFQGELFVITEVSYRKDKGPFKVLSENMRKFTKNHFDIFGECFFNGDIIIISIEFRTVWMFTHEGAYSLLEYIP